MTAERSLAESETAALPKGSGTVTAPTDGAEAAAPHVPEGEAPDVSKGDTPDVSKGDTPDVSKGDTPDVSVSGPGHIPAGRAREAGSTGPEAADAAPAGPLLKLVQRQEIAFALVGGFNTLMGMVLTIAWLTVLNGVVSKNVAAALSVALAYAVGMVVAFVLHRTLVFRVRGRVLRDFLAFVGVNSVGMVLNMVLLQFAVSVLHAPAKPAAVVVMGLVAIGSFFGHRHISFRRSPHDSQPETTAR
ncbi:GtrA family protein [Nocardia sp. NPDC051030]|uniref:GtrA family protein n=1 Tax=Nocardia sp. NPDC051030 TaxID=3155162 RepID=UPI003430300F